MINLQDEVHILRIVAGITPPEGELGSAIADVDENGLVTVDDAVLVMRGLTSAKVIPGRMPLEPIELSLPALDSGGRLTVPLLVQAPVHPFNPETVIRYQLPAQSAVHLTIFNSLGQAVETSDPGTLSPGLHRVIWDAGKNAPGLYIVVIEADGVRQQSKMMYVK